MAERARATGTADLLAAPTPPPQLAAEHISFSYGPMQVLFDVTVHADPGETLALLGTNGAGKSTLLGVISGLLTPSAGSVHLDGRDITPSDAESRVMMGIGQLPGGKAVFPNLTVLDNLRVGAYSLGRKPAGLEERMASVIELFPVLGSRLRQRAGTLSGGEQQMLGLAKVLLIDPRVLLIDELSLGLAPVVVQELLAIVEGLKGRGITMVIVEQSVNVALSVADRAVFMEKGQVQFDGPAAELRGRDDLLRAVFLPDRARTS